MAKNSSVRDQWARIGAMARLQELDQERAAILAAFPELRSGGGAAKPAKAAGSRRTMSADAKKRMSAGMRKYWAKRKAAEAAKKSKG